MPRSGVDYADYNITVYRYCPYQCLYCYVWRTKLFASRVWRGKYDPVEEAMKISMKCSKGERVVVSFTSDPYPYREALYNLTRGVIFNLRYYGYPTVMVLTKNPLLALKDKDIMLSHIVGAKHYVETWLGTTITTAFDQESIIIEPNAPRTSIRLKSLLEYQKCGGYVWVSIEPIIPLDKSSFYPKTIVRQIIETLDTDKIKLVVLGRLNYIKLIRIYLPYPLNELTEEKAKWFYKDYVPEAIDLLKEHGIPYHVKKELAKVLEQ